MYGTSNEQGTPWTAYGDASSLPDWTTPKSSEYDVSIPTCSGAETKEEKTTEDKSANVITDSKSWATCTGADYKCFSDGSSGCTTNAADPCYCCCNAGKTYKSKYGVKSCRSRRRLAAVGVKTEGSSSSGAAVADAAADTAGAVTGMIPGGRRLLSKRRKRKLVGCNPTCPSGSGSSSSGSSSKGGCLKKVGNAAGCVADGAKAGAKAVAGGAKAGAKMVGKLLPGGRRLAAVGVKESTTCTRTKTLQVRSLVKNEDKTTTIYFHDTLAELIVSEDKAHFQSPLCKFILPFIIHLKI